MDSIFLNIKIIILNLKIFWLSIQPYKNTIIITTLISIIFILIFLLKKKGNKTALENNPSLESLLNNALIPKYERFFNDGIEIFNNDNIEKIKKEEEEIKENNFFNEIQNDYLKNFYLQKIEKNIDIFKKTQLLEPIQKVILFLQKHGCVPSVVKKDSKWEDSTKNITYTFLSKIDLIEHSVNVAVEAINSQSSLFSKINIPQLAICGLAHDLGKIEELWTREYNTNDHSEYSADFLNKIIPDNNNLKEDIIDAVKNHHSDLLKKNSLATQLQEADQKARQKELESFKHEIAEYSKQKKNNIEIKNKNNEIIKQYKIIELEPWFSINMFKEYLIKHVNIMKNKGYFSAFSFKGYIYVNPALIAEIAIEIATIKQNFEIMTPTFVGSQQCRNNLIFSIRTKLNKYIDENIGETFIGQSYEIIDKNGNTLKPFYFLPFKDKFFNSQEKSICYNNLKKNILLSSIKKVQPKY